VLFCRQPRAAIVGLAARDALASRGDRGPRVVLDLRGIRDVEYLLTLGKRLSDLSPEERDRLVTYQAQEELACRRADAVLTVSRPMEKLVRERYAVDGARLGRMPNHAEPVPDAEARREKARADLGIAADTLLVAYSGTLAAWQMPDASVRIFEALKKHREDARLLFLTPEADAAAKIVAKSGVKDVLIRSAPPGEAARLLAAADYGLLLRQDDLVNRVACPVKFGEYLACGVRPVVTPYVGDQSKLCETSDLGVVVGLGAPAEAGRLLAADAARPGALGPDGRERRRKWAAENISPARAAKRVAEFLKTALAG
jgi:glycosyltransferase involved in cell wall biosynthesis